MFLIPSSEWPIVATTVLSSLLSGGNDAAAGSDSNSRSVRLASFSECSAVVGHIDLQQRVNFATVVNVRWQRFEHVRVEVHEPGSRPVFGIWNHRWSVTTTPSLHNKDLIFETECIGVTDFPVSLEVCWSEPTVWRAFGVIEN